MILIFVVLLVYFIVAISSRISERALSSSYGVFVSKREENGFWYVKFKVDSEIREYKVYIRKIYDRLEKGKKGTLLYKDNILEEFLENY